MRKALLVLVVLFFGLSVVGITEAQTRKSSKNRVNNKAKKAKIVQKSKRSGVVNMKEQLPPNYAREFMHLHTRFNELKKEHDTLAGKYSTAKTERDIARREAANLRNTLYSPFAFWSAGIGFFLCGGLLTFAIHRNFYKVSEEVLGQTHNSSMYGDFNQKVPGPYDEGMVPMKDGRPVRPEEYDPERAYVWVRNAKGVKTTGEVPPYDGRDVVGWKKPKEKPDEPEAPAANNVQEPPIIDPNKTREFPEHEVQEGPESKKPGVGNYIPPRPKK